MCISLFSSVLPSESSYEGSQLNQKLRLPTTGNPKGFSKNYSLNKAFAKLILEISLETVRCIKQGTYRSFYCASVAEELGGTSL